MSGSAPLLSGQELGRIEGEYIGGVTLKSEDYHLTIPAKVADQLHLDGATPVKLVAKNNRLVVQFAEPRQGIYRSNVWVWPLICAALVSITFYIYCQTQRVVQVPLSGNQSIAAWLIVAGTLVGMILFAGFFIKNRNSPHHNFAQNVYWRNFPIIVLSFALILVLALLGGAWVLDQVFRGASFDIFTASVILFVFSVFVNLVMVYAALAVDAGTLSTLLTLVIILGVVISMASNGQRHWWQHNLSFLGTTNAANSWQFNMTLIFSALLMVALVDYLFVSLRTQFPGSRQLFILRVLLTLTAADLALVGLFPNNGSTHAIHDRFAGLLVYCILALIVGVRWLLPRVTPGFLWLSYGVAIGLILIALGFQVFHYLSLTAFEIIDFALAFGWLLLLLDRIQDLISTGTESIIEP